jgi:ACS family hexuronate transporter-like MFS transporter
MWVASLVIMLCSWLSYVDRQTLAVLSPMILRDTGLSIAAFSDAVSAFSIAYMIGNPLWGRCSIASAYASHAAGGRL